MKHTLTKIETNTKEQEKERIKKAINMWYDQISKLKPFSREWTIAKSSKQKCLEYYYDLTKKP